MAAANRLRMLLWIGLLVGLFGWSTHSACVIGANCRYDTDCPADSLCQDRKCTSKFKVDGGTTKGCERDSDCPNTHVCLNRQCSPLSSLFDGSPPPDHSRPPPGDRPATGDRPQPPSDRSPAGDGDSPEQSTPDQPPPPLGPTPLSHVISSGGALSDSKKHRHLAIIGQATPSVPASTVMRSGKYSARAGFIAVTLW